MHVHSAELLEHWVFGDFQFSRLSPNEHQKQRIESLHLANRERAPGRGPASDGERASHPDAAADPPATRDGNQLDPWQEAVDYISARRNTVEARMLASVAFGQGSGGEKEVLTWEEKVLDPRAVSIARRLMALRSKKLSENGGMRDLPHRGSKIELDAGEAQED
jgi:hypothetical protein